MKISPCNWLFLVVSLLPHSSGLDLPAATGSLRPPIGIRKPVFLRINFIFQDKFYTKIETKGSCTLHAFHGICFSHKQGRKAAPTKSREERYKQN